MTVAELRKMQQGAGCSAFGVSLQDLARAGRPPVVLLDSLKFLARFALSATPNVFTGVTGDKRKLLALKQLYDAGKRPLRNKAKTQEPVVVANLLLLWLGSLPEPLFPAEYVPDLLRTQHTDCYLERVAAVRSFLKKTEPFILEALFPLFEFLHHHLINQADRDSALRELGCLFAPFVFGTPQEYGLPAEDAALLADTVELMIAEYRPLFTQPYGLNRYEQDAARAQAAAAAKAAAAAQAAAALSPPLIIAPLRTAVLTAGGDAADAAATQAGLASSDAAQFWTPFGCYSDSPLGSDGEEEGGSGRTADVMECVLSLLLESTVSGLFEDESLLAAAAPVAPGAQELLPAAPPARVASPAKAVPVPARGACRREGQPGAGGAAEEEGFTSAGESYSSCEDWGSFSPTGVILGEAPEAAAAAAAAGSPQHGAWGCKPAGPLCGGLVRMGGSVLA